MRLLKIKHYPQEFEVGCLAACAQMVLESLGLMYVQRGLHQLFEPTSLGVPFSRIARLQRYGLQIDLKQGDLPDILQVIDQDIPPIIFLRTGDLDYWHADVQHAVVVVGYDDNDMLLNDPAFPTAPQRVLVDEVMLAWDELDNFYALVTR